MSEKCIFCGRHEELRMGVCFDCAMSGESKSAKRTVLGHLKQSLKNIKRRRWDYVRYDLTWAFQRLTRSGDYATGGYFDQQGHEWR